MTAGPANLIKAQIRANLDALIASNVLGAVIERDLNNNVLAEDMPGYPCAILGTSNMEADWEYQQSNRRTYNFPILIVQLQDQLNSVADMEDLRDAIALQFDNNVTLAGTATYGVRAAISERAIVQDSGKNYVVFSVTIRARTYVDLTYNF